MKTVGHNTIESYSDPLRECVEARLRHDAFARSMAMRCARFDPDARRLVLPFGVEDPETKPEDYGFEKMPDGYHWTARGLFHLTGLPPAPPARLKMTRSRFRDIFEEIEGEQAANRIGGPRGDPLHFLPQLRQIRVIVETPLARGLRNGRFCLELAVALGYCRLFGVSMSDADDCTLSFLSAIPAAVDSGTSARMLGHTTEAATRYVSEACERLEARMNLWAASVALEEALDGSEGSNGAEARLLGRLLKSLRRRIGRIDGNLQRHLTSLRPAAGTNLLSNWRRLLAPCHREVPPWWLDGCIG